MKEQLPAVIKPRRKMVYMCRLFDQSLTDGSDIDEGKATEENGIYAVFNRSH